MKRINFLRCFILIIGCFVLGFAFAQSSSSGFDFDRIKAAATQGDPDAEYALGYLYYYGRNGAPRDEQAARMWIGKAAAQGQPQAAEALKLLQKTKTPQGGTYAASSPSSSSSDQGDQGNSSTGSSAASSPNLALSSDASSAAASASSSKTSDQSQAASSPDQSTMASSTSGDDQNAAQPDNDQSASGNNVAVSAAPSDVSKKNASHAQNDHHSLLTASMSAYTIQLMGSRSKKEAVDFVQIHGLQKSKAHIYKTQYNAKPWYVLVYGIYNTDHAAKVALQKLPTPVRQFQPWVKSMKSVQLAIRSGEETQTH